MGVGREFKERATQNATSIERRYLLLLIIYLLLMLSLIPLYNHSKPKGTSEADRTSEEEGTSKKGETALDPLSKQGSEKKTRQVKEKGPELTRKEGTSEEEETSKEEETALQGSEKKTRQVKEKGPELTIEGGGAVEKGPEVTSEGGTRGDQ